MKRWTSFLPLGLFIVLAIGLTTALLQKQSNPSAPVFAQHINDPAPTLIIDDFDPQKMRGKPYILNFFASWCLPCHAEHEFLMQLKQQNAKLVGIAFRDQTKTVSEFLGRAGNPFTVVAYDKEGRGSIEWGLTGVPETFIIDGAGIIRWHHAGPLTAKILQDEMLPLWHGLK